MTSLPWLYVEELPYQPDSNSLMARLGTLPGAAFLDSSNSPAGRYDILSALPLEQLLWQADDPTDTDPTDRTEDVFHAVGKLMARYGSQNGGEPALAGLPFQGGIIGYLGYPAPGERGTCRLLDASVGFYCWALIVDHERHETRIFFLPSCPAETRQRVYAALRDTPATQGFALATPFASDTSEQQYFAAFARIRDYILAGDSYQVNLTQRFSAFLEGSSLTAYLRLRRTGRNPFSAYLRCGVRTLLCLSPERFLRLQGQHVFTQPIKGTRPRHGDPGRDRELANELLASEKDRAENLMIVDLLRNDLGAVCETGSVVTEKLFELQSFNNVHHLVSTISGRLNPEKQAMDLMRNCFPGGSITGAPKRRAMQIIEEVERHPRSVYCGSIFYLGMDGHMDSNITIRTLLEEEGNLHCWAGGGIVADSVPEQEYAECYDKIQWIIDALQE